MGRVSSESIEKFHAFLDSLPEEARNKCALCNDTLTHIVKRGEVATGVGTATATRLLADRINETAAPQDRVEGNQLRNRVQYNEGKAKCGNSANSQQDLIGRIDQEQEEEEPEMPAIAQKQRPDLHVVKMSMAKRFGEIAITQLERIEKDDPEREATLNRVIEWCRKQITSK